MCVFRSGCVCVCVFFVYFGHLFCSATTFFNLFPYTLRLGRVLLACIFFFRLFIFSSQPDLLILLLSPGNGSFLTRSLFSWYFFLPNNLQLGGSGVFPPFWIGAGNSILLAVKSNRSVLRNIIKAHKRIGKVVKAKSKRPVPVANRYCFGTGLFFIQQF